MNNKALIAFADKLKWADKPLANVDCFIILSDDNLRKYFKLGCKVKALGRGHLQSLKKELQKSFRNK